MEVLVTQSCPTLCDPMDCSPLGSSVHGILQARVLEWVAILLFSRRSSRPRDQTQISYIAGRFFTVWATRETLVFSAVLQITTDLVCHSFHVIGVQARLSWVSCLGFHELHWRCQPSCLLWGSGASLKPVQMVGNVQFPTVSRGSQGGVRPSAPQFTTWLWLLQGQ